MKQVLKIKLKYGEKARKYLIKTNNYDNSRMVECTNEFIFFPINKEDDKVIKKFSNSAFINKNLKKSNKKLTLKKLVELKLTKKEQQELKKSYDMIGDIAILELPSGLVKKQEIIANLILKLNKNIKTVVKKAGEHEGIFRTRKLVFLAGQNKRETIHKENRVSVRLDVEKIYFSPRLATERKRIASIIRKGENILVMFSGCAIYPLVISKNSEAKSIIGIELNPVAHKYALENIEINKLNNIELIKGDVKKIIPGLNKKFDRIIMPLPKSAENFLDLAFKVAKNGCIIHFYYFMKEEQIPKGATNIVKQACKKYNKKCKILKVVKCGQYSPRVFRVCVDFKVF